MKQTFRSIDERASSCSTEARAWHLRADWSRTRVWTDDDLAARVHANAAFEVRWEPADETMPDLSLVAFGGGRWRETGQRITLVDSERGSARLRLAGLEPDALWNVSSNQQGELENTSCSGFAHCEFGGGNGRAWLHPVGISPAKADGVAPPRACVAAPGDERTYFGPNWQPIPDPSTLRIDRNTPFLLRLGVVSSARCEHEHGTEIGASPCHAPAPPRNVDPAGCRIEPRQRAVPHAIASRVAAV